MSLPKIAANDAKRLIDQGATLVDIRSTDERARQSIPGSLHGPLGEIPNLHDVSRPIIFHCHAGKRTAANAAKLKEAASGEAYILSGGIEAWNQERFPIVANANQPIEINRQVMIAGGTLVLLGVLLGTYLAPAFYLLAAFAGAGLVFGGVSGWCGMAKLLGVIPWNRPATRT